MLNDEPPPTTLLGGGSAPPGLGAVQGVGAAEQQPMLWSGGVPGAECSAARMRLDKGSGTTASGGGGHAVAPLHSGSTMLR